jgi:hypothetical protein
VPAVVRRRRFERLLVLHSVLGLTGCGANCLRDSDCDDGHCVPARQLCAAAAGRDASASGAAGQAGGQGLINPSLPGHGRQRWQRGVAVVGGASMTEQGGAAGRSSSQGGARGRMRRSGGSATQPRENLDASVDADAGRRLGLKRNISSKIGALRAFVERAASWYPSCNTAQRSLSSCFAHCISPLRAWPPKRPSSRVWPTTSPTPTPRVQAPAHRVPGPLYQTVRGAGTRTTESTRSPTGIQLGSGVRVVGHVPHVFPGQHHGDQQSARRGD